MKITKLSLTNFRSFKDKQTIEFAPLTLFLGPNSVGKSNALLALSYVEHILKTGDCNPNYIPKFGPKLLGGFRGLVHKRDLEKEIKISIEFEKGDQIGKTYSYLKDHVVNSEFEMVKTISDVKSFRINLVIAWSKAINNAYVQGYIVYADDEPVFIGTSDPRGRQPVLQDVNFFSDLLINETEKPFVDSMKRTILSYCENKQINDSQAVIEASSVSVLAESYGEEPPIDEEGLASSIQRLVTLNTQAVSYVYHKEQECITANPSISYKSMNGALPTLNALIQTSLSLDDEQQQVLVHELLSEVVVAPLDNLLTLLEKSVHIGPLRHIQSSLNNSVMQENGNWYDGSIAWSELVAENRKIIKTVNDWMCGNEKLNLGVGIKARLRLISDSIFPADAEFNSKKVKTHTAIEKLLSLKNELSWQRGLADNFLNTLNEYFDDNDLSKDILEFLRDLINEDVDDGFMIEGMRDELKDFADILDSEHLMEFLLTFVSRLDKHIANINDQSNDINDILSEFRNIKLDYTLWDIEKEMAVEPSDIGVGLSQLKPLIIAANLPSIETISIEQPELHVHPRIQTSTADLLISCAKHSTFMVETHSEHLLLRIKKRIRQTSENELPSKDLSLNAEQVSIIYFEAVNDGVEVKRIRLDEDGEFIDRWPHGFFSERRVELM